MARRVKPRLVVSVVAVALASTGLAAVPASAACVGGTGSAGPGAVYLRDFTSGNESGSLFYAAREEAQATAVVGVSPGDCTGPHVSGFFATDGGSATEGSDFQDRTGQTSQMCDDVHYDVFCGAPRTSSVNIPTFDDSGDNEAAVESFTFRLTAGTSGVEQPSSAPVHIIDLDGSPRAALEPSVAGYSRSESSPRILVPVFLAGTANAASVSYTLTPDPSAPATPGQDIEDRSGGSMVIGASRLGFIELGIVDDKIGEPAESLVVTLTGGTGVGVAVPSTITVTIQDNEENQKPRSRFHHPRHKWRYAKSDYRIREFHVFATDEGPAGVAGVQFALKRTRMNGTCQWFQPGGWQTKDCQNRQWIRMKYDPTGELWLYRMKQLKSSVGTKIKNYTAISRAIDGAENVESQFNEKRNDNTFEIKRSTRRR
jgi:hypothetical protein